MGRLERELQKLRGQFMATSIPAGRDYDEYASKEALARMSLPELRCLDDMLARLEAGQDPTDEDPFAWEKYEALCEEVSEEWVG